MHLTLDLIERFVHSKIEILTNAARPISCRRLISKRNHNHRLTLCIENENPSSDNELRKNILSPINSAYKNKHKTHQYHLIKIWEKREDLDKERGCVVGVEKRGAQLKKR